MESEVTWSTTTDVLSTRFASDWSNIPAVNTGWERIEVSRDAERFERSGVRQTGKEGRSWQASCF